MPNQTTTRIIPLAFGAALLLACPLTAAAQPTTTMVSISSEGYPGNSHSGTHPTVRLSGNGRYAVFASYASNLVENDTNNALDIFVRDRNTGQTSRVSVSSSGVQGNADSIIPAITPDGRYIVFTSKASNLVTGDTNSKDDIFVHDLQTGQTTRVSVSSNGAEGGGGSYYPTISDDGCIVAFASTSSNLDNTLIDSNNTNDIYVHNCQTGKTVLVSKSHINNSPGNSWSAYPAISGNGRYVAFYSEATSLTGNSDTNNAGDVFIRDLQAQTTNLVSITPNGSAGNGQSNVSALSSDGRYVVFDSGASDLVSGDTNNRGDVFVRDRNTNQTTRVSMNDNGSETTWQSSAPAISADGRFISYRGNGTQHYDRLTGKTTRVNVNNSGAPGDADCDYNAISADGQYVIFASHATNLVDGDISGFKDVFVRGPLTGFPWPMFLPALTGGQK